MPGLKLFYDLMSQPSRAVYMFLKLNNIPFEPKPIALRKGEHHTDEYLKINPFGLVPAIDDNGFLLSESVAILSYLSDHYNVNVADHWYPKNLQARARVDQYNAWQQNNIRLFGSMVFRIQVIEPKLMNIPIDVDRLTKAKASLETVLDVMENIFLKENAYLAGDHISIADLLGVCELMQPYAAGYDISAGRPQLAAYVQRMKQCMPCFDEAHAMVYKVRDMFLNQPKSVL